MTPPVDDAPPQQFADIPVVGKCQHCGAQQYDNPDADPALDAMAHLCWKCVKPWNTPTTATITSDDIDRALTCKHGKLRSQCPANHFPTATK